MQFYVYIFFDGDVPVYVGKGQKKRAWKHFKATHNGVFWQFITKCRDQGISLEPKIVFQSDDEVEALARERAYIERFGRVSLRTGTLFNIAAGGLRKGARRATNEVIIRAEYLLALAKKNSLYKLEAEDIFQENAVLIKRYPQYFYSSKDGKKYLRPESMGSAFLMQARSEYYQRLKEEDKAWTEKCRYGLE